MVHPTRAVVLVTLTTDFGLRDGYVAAMKGVILQVHPGLRLVDISHEIPPQDVMAAAFVMRQAIPFFPDEAVHLAVVDPGVGTDRKLIAASTERFMFVGPDNGLLSLLLGEKEAEKIVVLDRPEAWRVPEPSATFHGRDVFAPVAAHLAAGMPLEEVGAPATDIKRLHWPVPQVDEHGIDAFVVHVDRFGNCITNLSAEELEHNRKGRGVKLYVGSTILRQLAHTYGSVAEGEPLALIGSSGLLEIGVRNGNASELLSIEPGQPVRLLFES